MNRLIENTVFCGFVTCCRFAGAPTSRWSSFVNATTDGVVRPPSAFGMTTGSPPSMTAMHEFVVPRSIPITFAMLGSPLLPAAVRCSENLSDFIADRARHRPPCNVQLVADPRVEEYGRLIVERSLDVQPGWQVVVRTTP